MLNNGVFYHGTIRKTIVAFGKLFSSIYIDRKQGDSVNGDTVQRLQIPLTYGPKEKWLLRIEQDPNLTNHTYVSLPRMAFEINSYEYDASRKMAKMNKIRCIADGTSSEMFSPVPYNINISLYILTKNQEDAMQIIEQILPVFGPEYTLSINAIPEMNIIQDIPVCLNSISAEDNYDGTFEERRFVTHTLTFTLKTNLFGPTSSNKIITHVNPNINNMTNNAPMAAYRADGDINTGIITEQWIEDL